MAPNKKKKKPASNPARGFATTSMASKAKNQAINDTEHDDSSGVPDQAADSLLEDGGVRLSGAPAKEPDKDLQDLTPEELELQLENSTLQILLDSCGEKAKKDVSRQVSRLRTERRLLRSQAEHLNTRQWLPSEIMRLIMDLLEVQTKDSDGRNYELEASKSICAISEDDMLVKLWALKRLLPQLGFSAHMTDLSLRNLLTKQRDPESQISSACKDSIWGLDECLNWLAFAAAPEDLPSFESRDDSRQIDSSNIRHSEGFVEAGEQTFFFIPSRISRTGFGSSHTTDAQLSTTPDSRPSTPISRATLGPQSSLDEASSVSSRSESDNDFEPEQQVIKYLALKSQLYEINPELAEVNPKKQKRKTTKSRNIKADQAQDADRRISRLTTRLKKIKSDILFDEDEANRRWVEIHFDLAKETAERKRLDIVNDQGQETRIESSVGRTNGIKAVEQNEDAGEMLGELFFGLPDTTTNLSTGASHLTTTDTGSTTIEVRDFGKWTGMSPRRVFEEACKAR